MSAYVAALNAAVEQQRQAHADRKQEKLESARERLTPLEERLARLLATIPPELQREGLSLNQLQVSLRGRWRGNCHPGELGRALRRLGFRRDRRWHSSEGFRALWYPVR